MKRTLFFLFVLVTAVYGRKRRLSPTERICPNAMRTKDPKCLNGGKLHAVNVSAPVNCATCDCRGTWRGVDCGLCTTNATCPEKDGRAAIDCTSHSIAPTEHEAIFGKSLSCSCGGPDGITQYLCQQQRSTNWQISISKMQKGNSFEMHIIERAGIPSQDYVPKCKEEDDDEQECHNTKDRYRYAASQVWEAKMTECSWKVGKCITPLEGNDCVVYTCAEVSVDCPPTFVKKCPGWSQFGCDFVPGEDARYWMHECKPMMYPFDGRGLTIACKQDAVDGEFQCYLSQEYSFLATIGIKCQTGRCVYGPKTVVY